MKAVYAFIKSQKGIICGLCAFLMFLSFKPSEPYLSQYLVCNKDTQQDYCSGFSNSTDCSENPPCTWMVSVDSIDYCSATTCFNVPHNDCGNSDYSYCKKDGQSCKDAKCYKSFSEDQVNDEIYPWSTYAYLPFLLLLGPAAELCSYRVAILIGISGRLVTRFLLLYGESILDMQLMQVSIVFNQNGFKSSTVPSYYSFRAHQVSYAFGTAAEDGKTFLQKNICVYYFC